MPLPPPANKPLLLIFPLAHSLYYERCLIVANHLRSLFDIRFQYTDEQASLVYQLGFDTFSSTSYTPYLSKSSQGIAPFEESTLELQFLEQVELLETLQPSVVIGDGSLTLGMAAEFTGVPCISLINGYQSPFYANKRGCFEYIESTQPFKHLRSKYGLQSKGSALEELEGDLNWICDLPEFFPQKELPYHYEIIGPLVETNKIPSASSFYKLSPLKKTILVDIDHDDDITTFHLLNDANYRCYNWVAEATPKNIALCKHIPALQLVNLAEVLPKTDLLLCSSQRLLYKGLLHEIPVLLINQNIKPGYLPEALDWIIMFTWG